MYSIEMSSFMEQTPTFYECEIWNFTLHIKLQIYIFQQHTFQRPMKDLKRFFNIKYLLFFNNESFITVKKCSLKFC